MQLFGKPKQHLVEAICGVCKNYYPTVHLEALDMYICQRCIERGILYAADEAVKHAFDSDVTKKRYSPPPPPPSTPLRQDRR